MGQNQTILLGVSGGVAAYKAVELVRLFKKSGMNVQVIMTEAAKRFVTPLTFQSVSGNQVAHDLWQPEHADGMDHIRFAEQGDLLLIAPATAHLIGRLAFGLADDLLTTTTLAFKGPKLIAPAMNVHMFENSLVQENLAKLKQHGFEVIGPNAGEMACGHQGLGRMSEPTEIYEAATQCINGATQKDLEGLRVLVTAGPTREAIDAVRFMSNPSSGKMGYALAQAAAARGAETTLVSGPTCLEKPAGVHLISVTSAQEMYDETLRYADVDVAIMAAAVSDFSVENIQKEKVNKTHFPKHLSLKENPDILAALGQYKQEKRGPRVLVGFSMETKNLVARSQEKLKKKNADFMIANNIAEPGSGFQSDTNRVTYIDCHGTQEKWPKISKHAVAKQVLDRALKCL